MKFEIDEMCEGIDLMRKGLERISLDEAPRIEEMSGPRDRCGDTVRAQLEDDIEIIKTPISAFDLLREHFGLFKSGDNGFCFEGDGLVRLNCLSKRIVNAFAFISMDKGPLKKASKDVWFGARAIFENTEPYIY